MNQLNQDYLVAAEAVPRETLDRTRTREDESPRVCVLAYLIPPHYGGAGRQATRYAAYLASLGEPVELLTCIPNPEPVPGVEITRFPMPDWYDLKGGSGIVSALRRRLYNPIIVRRLRQYFLDKKIQVVHCVAAKWFSLLAVEAARQAGVPSILETSLLGKDDAEAVGQRTFGRLQLTLFKRADVVVNTSPSLEAACLRAGVEKDRCELIVNPIDTERFKPVSMPAKKQLRQKLGIENADHVLLTVGVLRPRKNTSAMISMVAEVVKTLPNTILVVVGPHDKDAENVRYTNAVQQQIRTLGLEQSVVLTGLVDNVPEWMQAADVFLFASESEGLPNVMLEALSSGLPAISTPIQGIAAFVIDSGQTGYVVDTLEEGVAPAVSLLQNPTALMRQQERARATALERFSTRVVMDQYRSLYAKLAARA